jgi:hypothetical protein
VNYFVQKLESLGATTCYSCAGHPYGFYVLFVASYRLACKIVQAGYFEVELERGGVHKFSIRIADRCLNDIVPGPGNSFGIAKKTSKENAEKHRRSILSHASESWERNLEVCSRL